MTERRDSFHRAVWLFAACSMLGFLMESLQSWTMLGYVENRQGLLYGPFTPVYGAGALLYAFFYPYLKNKPWPLIFVSSALLGSLVEFIWSWSQESLFHVVFWNYAMQPLQIQGRVSLNFALCWGVLGLAFYKGFYPLFLRLMASVRGRGKVLVSWSILLLMICNFSISIAAFSRQAQRREQIAPATMIDAFLDQAYPDERLKQQFPTMQDIS